jgi:hypothetical protein
VQLLFQYVCSCLPYLEAISFIRNLRTHHAVATSDPPNMGHSRHSYLNFNRVFSICIKCNMHFSFRRTKTKLYGKINITCMYIYILPFHGIVTCCLFAKKYMI